jgi:hypothetical protein
VPLVGYDAAEMEVLERLMGAGPLRLAMQLALELMKLSRAVWPHLNQPKSQSNDWGPPHPRPANNPRRRACHGCGAAGRG